MGSYYGAAAVVAWALAVALPWSPASFLLAWPALALSLVAAGYHSFGPSVYGKTGGRLPWSTRLLLGPVLLGHRLSLRHYLRRAAPWSRLGPELVVGARLDDRQACALVEEGVTAVLDLTSEFSEATPFLDVTYRNLPILDLTGPSPDQLRSAIEFLREQTAKGKVYVHCKLGYSRTAAVVGAYLLETGAARTAEEAVERLARARPSLVVRPEAWATLRAYERGLRRTQEGPA